MDPLRGLAPLSGRDLLTHGFRTTWLGPGFDLEEVDLHLEALAQSLHAWERGEDGSSHASASQAAGIAFTQRRMRTAYEPGAVDALLDQVAAVLAGYEAGTLRPPERTLAAPDHAATAFTDLPLPTASAGAPLTADEVVHMLFSTTRFRDGYDQDAVDNYLDECVAALRGDGSLTAKDVRSARFPMTRFRDGYDMAEVDEMLERVAATLEGGGRA